MADWFPYPTNYSNGTSVNGIWDLLFAYPKEIIGGQMYGLGLTVLIWVSVFGISLAAGSRKALLEASFITFFFALWLAFRGMVQWMIPITLIFLIIIGAIGSKEEKYY